jgi:hypothetical protein
MFPGIIDRILVFYPEPEAKTRKSVTWMAAKRIFGPQGKRKLGLPPPIPQIMILKLCTPRCIMSKESIQQKWIDELWFRKQLSTCLFFCILIYDILLPLCTQTSDLSIVYTLISTCTGACDQAHWGEGWVGQQGPMSYY